MGLEVIVSEEDFVATYKDGLNTARDYWEAVRRSQEAEQDRKAMEHAVDQAIPASVNCNKIARGIGRHPSTIKQWLNKGIQPDCIKGLEHARQLGLVPLTCDSERIQALNRLCSWIFWTGCVAESYAIMICEAPEQVRALQKYFKDALGINSEFKERQNSIIFNGNSHYYGRLLHCMGIPTGDRKSTHEIHVPKSVYCSPQSRTDFLQVLLATRTDQSDNNYWYINLLSNRKKERAEQFGREMISFINETLPKLQLSEQQLAVLPRNLQSGYKRGKQNIVYGARIALYAENIMTLAQDYPQLAAIRPKPVVYEPIPASTSPISP